MEGNGTGRSSSTAVGQPEPHGSHPATAPESQQGHAVIDSIRTTCCIVGGGPAGSVLALLLARKGVDVVLLEAHGDFDRDFRGDTIHPSVMEIMDQIGLADRLLELPHTKIRTAAIPAGGRSPLLLDLGVLKTRFPYITMLPQARFLDFITSEAAKYPSFRLLLGANVRELIQDNGGVRGVRYRGRDGWHEVEAALTIGADGRFSEVRRLAGFEPIKTSPPMDVLWFRLPRTQDDPTGAQGRFGNGSMLVMLDRGDEWQCGYVIRKGSYSELHAGGIEKLHQAIIGIAPELADRIQGLSDWKHVSLLSVESSRVPRWWRPGLLVIGDAAHVMSPVGGVGINYAIQDAVVAANVLTQPLLAGKVNTRELAAVQKQREWPTRVIQAVQAIIQKRVLAKVLEGRGSPQMPALIRLLLRVPWISAIPARVMGFGVRRVRLRD